MNREDLDLIASQYDVLAIVDILEIDEYAILQAFDYLVKDKLDVFLPDRYNDD